MRILRLAIAAAFLGAVSTAAAAMEIPSAAKLALPQSGPATGLSGTYYDGNALAASVNGMPSAAQASEYVAGLSPDATFTATALNYCTSDCLAGETSLAQFLGADAATLSGANPGQLTNAIITFTGYLNIPGTANGDGSYNRQVYGFQNNTSGGSLTSTIAGVVNPAFLSFEPGVYSFSAMYIQGSDVAHLALAHSATYLTALPVPEPGEWAMMVAGLGIVGFVARRRRA